MKKFKVIKEFPGLQVGDIIYEDSGSGFYVNTIEEYDSSEEAESLYSNTVAINKEAVMANVGEYFEEITEEKVDEASTPVADLVDEMSSVAAYLESDSIMAINNYHKKVIDWMLQKVYSDIELLTSTNL